MILRRAGLNPLCRQCGHEIDRPTARCPMCGMRTGLVEPLQSRARKTIAEPILVSESFEEAELDDAGDVVLAPPVERPVAEVISFDMRSDDSEASETDVKHAPVARNVSLGSLMLGTMLIAACLGLSRASMAGGVVAFLILVPAYIRTLSAIYYYRQRERLLGGHDIAAIYATSFVLSVMGLAAGGIVLGITRYAVVRIAGLGGWDDAGTAAMFSGVAAAFVTVLVLIHKVWPVNED
jgi:hypothetical protein